MGFSLNLVCKPYPKTIIVGNLVPIGNYDCLLVHRKDYESFVIEAKSLGYMWSNGRGLTLSSLLSKSTDKIMIFDNYDNKRISYSISYDSHSYLPVLYISGDNFVKELYNSF